MWNGKIKYKTKGFIKKGHAEITADKIIIRKKQKEDSKVIHEIPKHQVETLTMPKESATQAVLTGYNGFQIKYQDDLGKKKKLNFWPAGFSQFPNDEEMPACTAAIAKFGEIEDENVINAAVKSYDKSVYWPMIFGGLFGILLSGILGMGVMLAATYYSVKIYQKEEKSTFSKVVEIMVILCGSTAALLVLQFILAVAKLSG